MKKYLAINIILFLILCFVIWKNILSPNNSKDVFTFKYFIIETYNKIKHPNKSIGVLYLFRNANGRESEIMELLKDYKKEEYINNKVYPFVYVNNDPEPSTKILSENSKTGDFSKIGELLSVLKWKTVLFDTDTKNIIKTYDLIANPYTILEVIRETKKG